MCEKIINEVLSHSDSKFADWLRPYLNINNNKEILIGVRTPILRKLAKKYQDIDNTKLQNLLTNNIHEIRALAIFIMLNKAKFTPEKMCELYLKNIEYINNWDLIDYSAPHIIAPIVTKNKLLELANSKYLWANRIAIVSTIYYIKQNDFELTLEIAKKFINHDHHLIHKATGWMLREVGKKNEKILKKFLNKYSKIMPSIMRSYATEKIKNK